MGVPFLLNVLETRKAKAAFLVAGFIGVLGNEFDEGVKTFACRDFDWDSVRRNCKRFYVFSSDDDHCVPLGKGSELAGKLGTKQVVVRGAGHFNAAAGFLEFRLLLEKIDGELARG